MTGADLDDLEERAAIVEFDGGESREAAERAAGLPVDPPVTAPEFSDEALALEFTKTNANGLRYVAAWNRWLDWNGIQWQRDETMAAFDKARIICREVAGRCDNPNVAKIIASAKTVAALERLAKADRRHAARTDQWDNDPWLLNTPGGVVDLRTGRIQAHRYEDFMTKATAVAPGGDCPNWFAFLNRVTGSDGHLIAYLKRFSGYALTGHTSEQVLAFAHGKGANGKTVFLGAISGILGDYHRAAPIETFTASNGDRHPTDLAMLQGARLVTAVETEEGHRWAESKIKTLTGGDVISARFMRGDFFEYTPQFKLFIAGNHKPGLRSVDEAIRRRFHLVPFTITIPPAERDHGLSEKLKAEWPGILQWMIDGCLEWQRCGLSAPDAVAKATAAYLEAEDSVSNWLSDRCEMAAFAWTGSTALFADWSDWAEKAGEFVGSQKRFSQSLENKGLKALRKARGGGFVGICLKGIPRENGPNPSSV